MLFDKNVAQMSEAGRASEGRDYQWRSFGEHCGTQQERTKVILRITLGPEENFVAGS